MANRAPAQVPTEQLFQQRTNAKRLHTNIVTRIHGLIAGRSAKADCDREILLLDGVYERLKLLNDEYVRRGNLDAQRRQNAVEYMQQIENARNQARQSVASYVEPAAAGRRGWNVSKTFAAPPSQLRNWNVTPINMAGATNQTNQANSPQHSIDNVNAAPPLLQDAVGQATIDLARGLAGVQPRDDDNTVEAQAKRRRLMLEQQLIDIRLRREQQLDELLREQNAGDGEILELIRREDQLIALAGQNVGMGQPVSSTPNRITNSMLPVAQWPALVGPQPNVAQFAPSSNRWTKIVVQPFDGDPRKWKIFELGVGATIRDTTMPDSHKLISLQAVLVEEIRKRMAHVFSNGYSFTQAFDELKDKYGSPGLVMQAHNTHLLAALPVRQGDFNALFTIAADVREAVASVDDTHLMAFTYSTVISSIVSKLPSQLQLDWGKLAYALKPNLPSMRDLDKWLDVAVGAEEYRGNRFVASTSAATQSRAAYPPRQQTSGSASYGAPGSSSYRQQSNIRAAAHNSTILTQSVAQGSNGTPIAACAVCKEDPGHRLDYCNIFKRMLVPQRAAAVADNNYCFRCLTKGHYGRDCRRPAEQTKCKTCGEAHNTLLHGAEMQFKKREVLDPGSEATLVKQSLATRLGLSGAPLQIRFGSFNGYSMVESQLVSFQIESSNGQLKVSQAFVVPDISLSLRRIDWPSLKSGWSNLVGIDLPAVDTSLVEILIGMDQVAAHISLGIAIEDGCPTAVKTPFGWTVVGRIPASLVSGPTSKVDMNLQSISAASVRDLNFDALPTEYVFGLEWEPCLDRYRLRVRPMPAVTTKRDLLSALSRFFDPLGICLPVTTYAKLLFQAACKSKSTITSTSSPLGWDEPLPAEILAKWNKYASELSSLSEVFIDRCFRPKDFPLDGCVFDLLLYCDASPLAMAAIAFGRFTFGEQVRYSFIMGRGRLTPSSSLTIPRLELQSCVMAVRLAETIKKELRIPIASVEFRTDSQIVIHQLLSSHLERPEFVKSRLHEILRHSTTAQWFHVSGKDNVADDATRGLTPTQFLPNCRWLTGPSLAVRAAPAVNSVALLHLEDPERLTVCAVNQLSVTPNSPVPAPMSSRTSVRAPKSSRPSVSKLMSRCRIDLAHLKREVALSLRDDPKSTDPISVAELDEAMRVCLITAAEESFPREFKALRTGKKLPNDSVLRNVSPYIDSSDGLLKVDGRLEHAELPEYTRHPIILAPDHQLTTLIIADAHDKILHGGVEHTLARVRERFYLPQGRRAIRRTVGRCQKCRFNHSRNTAPRMANLPKERLRGFVRPFTITGLDLFGPFRTVIGRRVEKRWILIATCFSIRGIHLELCYSLSADSCLMAVRRFISDRGHPETIFSDNGTNLVATEKELREGLANLNSSLVTEEMVNRGIDWKFSPPGGSHFGGSYERLVASCKRALLAVLGGRAVSDEVLLTVIKEIANILNSRPITRVSTDPTEEGPLTPNHFILGCHHPHAPPDAETAFDGLSRRHWKQAQFIIDQWWRRWMREYVPELIARDKWQQHTRQMRVGDEVVVIDENNRRGHWPRGFVTKTFPGDGGVIRRVAVKIGRSELIRPVIKLCLVSNL